MKKSFLLITIVAYIFVFFPSNLFAQNVLKNAQSFSIDGVSLGMTQQEFMQKYPHAQPFKRLNHSASGTIGLIIGKTQSTDGMIVTFFEEKLLEFAVIYFEKRISDIGGNHVLIKRLSDNFGKADTESKKNSDEKVRLLWIVDEAGLHISYVIKPEAANIRKRIFFR